MPRISRRYLFPQLTFWRVMKLVAAVLIFSVVIDSIAEAVMLSKHVVWLKDSVLRLTWRESPSESTHYRLEVATTDLMAEPPTSYYRFVYLDEAKHLVELEEDHSYVFRVQAMNEFGTFSAYTDSTSIFLLASGAVAREAGAAEEIPSAFSLSQNHPNPFNSHTSIEYSISESTAAGSHARIIIFNQLGQRIRTLVDKRLPPGTYHAVWDGRTDSGERVASGSYLYRLTVSGFQTTKKMVFLK